jgi:hypothetical protein
MLLEGSCHCQAVTFSVNAQHPYPYNICYCQVCRKTSGSGGFAINLGASTETLKVTGKQHISIYQARICNESSPQKTTSKAKRHFCSLCGSPLYLWDPRWPELVHPHASAIDTPLPMPPEKTHLMLNYKANWVTPCVSDNDQQFPEYPNESIQQWHQRLSLEK